MSQNETDLIDLLTNSPGISTSDPRFDPYRSVEGGPTPGNVYFGTQVQQREAAANATPGQTAAEAVAAVEERSAETTAQSQLDQMLRAANIDPNNPQTREMLATIGGNAREQLTFLQSQPGSDLMLISFLDQNPDVALTRPTPYSQALDEHGFTTTLSPQALGEAQQKAQMSGISPKEFPTLGSHDYEYSTTTGAIRYANGTIVTADGGIIFDPTSNAPGSPQWLREAQQSWSAAEIAKWRKRLESYGYLPKDSKGGFTVELYSALQSYWQNYYIAGGKPIAQEAGAAGAGGAPPIDYADFYGQIQNDVRNQFRDVFNAEPTEEQIKQWSQFVTRTATSLQQRFREKYGGSQGAAALTEATERAIGQFETSDYAGDVRENTQLRDALQNAAIVTGGLIS